MSELTRGLGEGTDRAFRDLSTSLLPCKNFSDLLQNEIPLRVEGPTARGLRKEPRPETPFEISRPPLAGTLRKFLSKSRSPAPTRRSASRSGENSGSPQTWVRRLLRGNRDSQRTRVSQKSALGRGSGFHETHSSRSGGSRVWSSRSKGTSSISASV